MVMRRLVDNSGVERLRKDVDAAVAAPGLFWEDLAPSESNSGDGPNFFTDLELSTRHSELLNFATKGPAAAVAARVMLSKTATFLYDQLFVKFPNNTYAAAAKTPWHQDAPYLAIEGEQICSVAIALDECDARESLAFATGTHLLPEHQPVHFATGEPHLPSSSSSKSLPPLPLLPDIQELPKVQYDLMPGDAVVFHGRTIHGGPGSFGRTIVLRFIGDDVRFSRARMESNRCAIPTADPVGLADGALLCEANHDAFPPCFTDPFFGTRGTSPTSTIEWSKGIAVNEERGDFA